MKKFLFFLFLVFSFASPALAENIYLFSRDDCGFCKAEDLFLKDLKKQRNDFEVVYLDVNLPENKNKFDQITERYKLVKATPVTLVGGYVIQGFNAEETTGQIIVSALNKFSAESFGWDQYLNGDGIVSAEGSSVCDENSTSCVVTEKTDTKLKIPLLGVVDLKEFSLFSLSATLGFVDGFNPCAMWVLLTFLLVLWQIGDRKKMIQVAGLFILAEAIMYWLILNFWFGAWDFVGMDKFVTPAVGGFAVLGGIYFLRRYFKNRNQLVCDVTSDEYKTKTEQKIKDLISSPLTILTALGIVGVAFSVNIIEFACSVGIPQAFTKVLEMNNLNVWAEQFFILIYTLFYMVDDFVIFGLAIYGFEKFYKVGHKYSNLSSLIGGILMIILGLLLVFAPGWLVF